MNDPAYIYGYSMKTYTRSELDIDNVDFAKSAGRALKSAMIRAYDAVDSSARNDRELPIYFAERIAKQHHPAAVGQNREIILAKKTSGFKTDNLVAKLDKFFFNFNIYNNWIPLFDQTYASPLNNNAFIYYNSFEGSTMLEHGDSLQQVQFSPRLSYTRAFPGFLWINKKTLAVTTVNMRLSKTANINYVTDINYYEEYIQVADSSLSSARYMPSKISSEFVSDRYISLHTRLHIGGLLLDRVPLLQRLGWRERLSFNSYWGDTFGVLIIT